jgi:hypothetical protein
MKIKFGKLLTNSGTIEVNFGDGVFHSYDVESVKEDGIQIPDSCTDYSLIQIKGNSTILSNLDVVTGIKTSRDNSTEIRFKGSYNFNNLPSLDSVSEGDICRVTDDTYTDNTFIEGAGKPINAGDNIIAVVVENTEPIITPEESIDGEYCVFLNMSNGQCLALLGDSENNNARVCIRNGLNDYTQISTINDIYNFACVLEGKSGTIIAFPDNYDEVEDENFIFRSTDFGQTWTKVYISESGVTIYWSGKYASSNREGLFALGISHDYGSQPLYSIDDGLTWEFFGISTPEGYAERNSVLTVLNNNTAIFNFCEFDNNQKRMFYIWHNISSTNEPILTKIGEITDSQRNVYEFGQVQIDNTTVLALGSTYRKESYRIDLSIPQMTRITDLPNDKSCYGIADENRVILSSGYISNDAGDNWIKIIEKDSVYWPEVNSVYLIDHNIYLYRYQPAGLSYSEVKIPTNDIALKWNKLAAGVNYENFVAENISASSIKKNDSEVLTMSDKGASNGVATLDSTGRIPYSQLPESAMEYKGSWDASTNMPTLVDGTGDNGDFYIVSAEGTATFADGRSVKFNVNDKVIYDSAIQQWARLPAGEVRSVNGKTGDVEIKVPNVLQELNSASSDPISSRAVYNYLGTENTIHFSLIRNTLKPTRYSVHSQAISGDFDYAENANSSAKVSMLSYLNKRFTDRMISTSYSTGWLPIEAITNRGIALGISITNNTSNSLYFGIKDNVMGVYPINGLTYISFIS